MQNRQQKLISPVEALNKGASISEIHIQNYENTDKHSDFNTMSALSASIDNHDLLKSQLSFSDDFALREVNKSKEQRQGMRLNDYNLMVRFEDGNQVSEMPTVYPLPNSPAWFLGISNLNGQMIPVFNLKRYFNIEENSSSTQMSIGKKPMLFVIQHGENATGIIIDKLLERLDIDENNIQHNIQLPTKLNDCVNNSYLLNKEVWYDLNCSMFLDSLEQQLKN